MNSTHRHTSGLHAWIGKPFPSSYMSPISFCMRGSPEPCSVDVYDDKVYVLYGYKTTPFGASSGSEWRTWDTNAYAAVKSYNNRRLGVYSLNGGLLEYVDLEGIALGQHMRVWKGYIYVLDYMERGTTHGHIGTCIKKYELDGTLVDSFCHHTFDNQTVALNNAIPTGTSTVTAASSFASGTQSSGYMLLHYNDDISATTTWKNEVVAFDNLSGNTFDITARGILFSEVAFAARPTPPPIIGYTATVLHYWDTQITATGPYAFSNDEYIDYYDILYSTSTAWTRAIPQPRYFQIFENSDGEDVLAINFNDEKDYQNLPSPSSNENDSRYVHGIIETTLGFGHLARNKYFIKRQHYITPSWYTQTRTLSCLCFFYEPGCADDGDLFVSYAHGSEFPVNGLIKVERGLDSATPSREYPDDVVDIEHYSIDGDGTYIYVPYRASTGSPYDYGIKKYNYSLTEIEDIEHPDYLVRYYDVSVHGNRLYACGTTTDTEWTTARQGRKGIVSIFDTSGNWIQDFT